jgi:hypothetical protein
MQTIAEMLQQTLYPCPILIPSRFCMSHVHSRGVPFRHPLPRPATKAGLTVPISCQSLTDPINRILWRDVSAGRRPTYPHWPMEDYNISHKYVYITAPLTGWRRKLRCCNRTNVVSCLIHRRVIMITRSIASRTADTGMDCVGAMSSVPRS